ncbi:MAG: sulfite exporter TauE/SafE family protein, partial [Bacteroidales bacterium]|nr:sulfite exporter TauE/SafE family protein [Bacteroidales bacterium]
MSWIEIAILITGGVLVGFINTLAGGGSIISLSLLMFFGLPANVANGTNRIAVLLQNVASVSSFRQQKVLDVKKGLWLAIPAVVGSIIGAWVAVDLNKEVIEKAIGVLMLFMLFFILYKPQRLLKEHTELINRKVSFSQVLVFFGIGLYGGFIQMGVGYFLLAGLVLQAGYELVKANAIKVLVVLLYTPFAMLVFIFNDQINYAYGFTLAIGNMLGAFVASRMAVKKGAGFVRWVIVAVILFTSAHLFEIIDFHQILG